MVSTNLAEAKKHLAHYTRLVKNGAVVVLCERNKPIAEIRPLGHHSAKRPKRVTFNRLKTIQNIRMVFPQPV
jgi:antitoxin (DNA-binding transcriptional repressor) of toxin-antitoxin stability system